MPSYLLDSEMVCFFLNSEAIADYFPKPASMSFSPALHKFPFAFLSSVFLFQLPVLLCFFITVIFFNIIIGITWFFSPQRAIKAAVWGRHSDCTFVMRRYLFKKEIIVNYIYTTEIRKLYFFHSSLFPFTFSFSVVVLCI